MVEAMFFNAFKVSHNEDDSLTNSVQIIFKSVTGLVDG